MLSEQVRAGKVLRLVGGKAVVRIEHALACSGHDRKCPYNAMYFGLSVDRYLEVEADNTAQARVGDWVEVGLPSRSLRWAIGAVYGSLLAALWLGLTIGCLLSRHFPAHETLTLTIASSLGLVLGVVVLRLLDRRYRPNYRVVGILGQGPQAPRESWQAQCRLCHEPGSEGTVWRSSVSVDGRVRSNGREKR